jgi:glycerophosphoryl diester phosphodiesterase
LDGFWHDISWVPAIRADWLTPIAQGFTELGYPQFFIALLPLLYWALDKKLATRLALMIIFTAIVNGFLKDLFNNPRPPDMYSLDPRIDSGVSYGMPSGHAQVAAAMWLWLAWEIRRWWAWPIAIFIALGVAFSRIYVGVHDLEDITVGFALGALSVPLFAWLISPRFHGWRATHWSVQIGVILLLQVVLWFAWPEPGGPGTKFAIGGMLTGWWAGVLLEQRHIHYRRHANWWVVLAAVAAGIAVVFLVPVQIEAGLTAIGVDKIAARWVQSFAIAIFVTALGPWLFIKARAGLRMPP